MIFNFYIPLTKEYCRWCLEDIPYGQLVHQFKKGKEYTYPRKINGDIVCHRCYMHQHARRLAAKTLQPNIKRHIQACRGLWMRALRCL